MELVCVGGVFPPAEVYLQKAMRERKEVLVSNQHTYQPTTETYTHTSVPSCKESITLIRLRRFFISPGVMEAGSRLLSGPSVHDSFPTHTPLWSYCGHVHGGPVLT